MGAIGDKDAARSFIVERGYTAEVAQGVVEALAAPSSGIPAGMMLTTVKSLAGRWEVGEDAGLEALAKSVELEFAKKVGKQMVQFFVHPPNGAEPFACEGLEGMSIKDVTGHSEGSGAKLLGEFIECACSGVMACSTCHVYVDPAWLEAVGAPSEAEQDMIELAHEPRYTSRLGCQVKLTPELSGLRLTIPSGANNMFDHIPFE